MQTVEFRTRQPGSHFAGTDPGAEERLVRIDVSNAMQQRLVQQGGLDGGLAAMEKRSKVFPGNGQGFPACAGKAT